MKLLLTGAGGDIADALCRVARMTWQRTEIHGSELKPEQWLLSNGFDRIHVLPRADDPGYMDEIRALQQQERFTAIVPVTDAELWRLSSEETDDLPLLMAAKPLLRIALDKNETQRWLERSGVPSLRTVSLPDATAAMLPLMIKPRQGHGSRGLEIVRTQERLAAVQRERTDDVIAQQYVSTAAEEFTCCVFRHRASGAVRRIALRRTLQGGLTGRATVEVVASIDAQLLAIATAADLEGGLNVQLRLTTEGPRVFEINPRFSSTVMMRHLLGFRDFVWTLQARFDGIPPEEWSPREGTRVFRLSRELVLFPEQL